MTVLSNFLAFNSNLCQRNTLIRTLSCKMVKKALVFLAPGAEEMEFVISVDVLRRAAVEVTVAGLLNEPIKCSRGVVIQPEILIDEAESKGPFDAVILPGGLGGAKALSENEIVGKLLQGQEASGRIIAAICAAPVALKAHKIGLGKKITSYPSVKDQLEETYTYVEDLVVVDENLITSRGPGTAFSFALKIVENLVGIEKSNEVAKGMLIL